MEPECSSRHSHVPVWKFHNMIRFYGEELLAPRPTHKLKNHPTSSVRDCLFNIFSATLQIGGHSSIRNLRTRHALVTRTHLAPRILTSQTETACFALFSVPLICSVIITTLQTTFYHSDETKVQQLGSRLKQRNLLEKRCSGTIL